jgi:competence protein ComFB
MPLKLHNYTETVVRQTLDELLAKREIPCKCEKCRLDIMAIALNNLPPQYYVSQKGEVFAKIIASYMDTRTRVITEIAKAVMQVEKHPQHQTENC